MKFIHKINNINKIMEMKINLDQIFGTSKTEDSDSDFKMEELLNSDTVSNQTYDNRYQFSMPIFDDKSQASQENKQITSIGFISNSAKVQENSLYKDSLPGIRLYYQSQTNLMRKKQQLQKYQKEKEIEEKKNITFQPAINKQSQKILDRKEKKGVEFKKNKRVSEVIEPSDIKKMKEEVKECTFKPTLVSKSNALKKRQKEDIFENLHSEYRMKQAKAKLILQEEEGKKNKKKLTKAHFQQFLNRNDEYQRKVQKKQELIAKTSKQYDLQSGKKMFTPQTSKYVPKPVHKKYFENEESIDEAFKPKSIFQKNQEPEKIKLFQDNQKGNEKFDENFAINQEDDEDQIVQEASLSQIRGGTVNMQEKLSRISENKDGTEEKNDIFNLQEEEEQEIQKYEKSDPKNSQRQEQKSESNQQKEDDQQNDQV